MMLREDENPVLSLGQLQLGENGTTGPTVTAASPFEVLQHAAAAIVFSALADRHSDEAAKA